MLSGALLHPPWFVELIWRVLVSLYTADIPKGIFIVGNLEELLQLLLVEEFWSG